MDVREYIVYALVFIPHGIPVYVGSTHREEERIEEHFSCTGGAKRVVIAFAQSWWQPRAKFFKWVVLWRGKCTKSQSKAIEQVFIDKFKTLFGEKTGNDDLTSRDALPLKLNLINACTNAKLIKWAINRVKEGSAIVESLTDGITVESLTDGIGNAHEEKSIPEVMVDAFLSCAFYEKDAVASGHSIVSAIEKKAGSGIWPAIVNASKEKYGETYEKLLTNQLARCAGRKRNGYASPKNTAILSLLEDSLFEHQKKNRAVWVEAKDAENGRRVEYTYTLESMITRPTADNYPLQNTRNVRAIFYNFRLPDTPNNKKKKRNTQSTTRNNKKKKKSV